MTATTATPTTSRAAHAGLWTLQVLLAAVYAFSAYGKLTAEAQNVAGFAAMGLGNAGMYVIGALELPDPDRARRRLLRRADDRRHHPHARDRRRRARRDPGDRRDRRRRRRLGEARQHPSPGRPAAALTR